MAINYCFVYDNNEDYKYNLDILCDIFGCEILVDLKNDISEKFVTIKLNSIDETKIFNLLTDYEGEELRILKIEDEILIGTDRTLNEMGL